ncbi:MAG: hypothetical protein R3F59_02150 [Myxococcota bacterium]
MRHLAVLALATCAACVTGPFDQTVLSSRTQPIAVNGLAGAPVDHMELEYYDATFSHSWIHLSAAVSASTPTVTGPQSLYSYNFGTVTVPPVAWSWVACGNDTARPRVVEQGYELGTFTEDAWDCTVDQLHAGVDAVNAGYACSTGSEITLVYYVGPC